MLTGSVRDLWQAQRAVLLDIYECPPYNAALTLAADHQLIAEAGLPTSTLPSAAVPEADLSAPSSETVSASAALMIFELVQFLWKRGLMQKK